MFDINPVQLTVLTQDKERQVVQPDIAKQLAFLNFALDTLFVLSIAEIEETLQDIPHPGAWPTAEFNTHPNPIHTDKTHRPGHPLTRLWAEMMLCQQKSFGVTGNILLPTPNNPMSIGLIQVGMAETDGTSKENLPKAVVEFISPHHLDDREAIDGRCFTLMVDQLCRYMTDHADKHPKPICLFEGSFTFPVGQFASTTYRHLHHEAVQKLLRTSQKTGVPVLSYAPSSPAADWVTMLTHLFQLDITSPITDAALLHRDISMTVGSRTHLLSSVPYEDKPDTAFYSDIYFAYLQTNDQPPVRIEFPRWLCQDQKTTIDHLFDVIRAHCFLGSRGVPNILKSQTIRHG